MPSVALFRKTSSLEVRWRLCGTTCMQSSEKSGKALPAMRAGFAGLGLSRLLAKVSVGRATALCGAS